MSIFTRLATNWRYLIEKPLRLVAVLVALGVGGAAGIPVQQREYDYMWANPNFCGDCHVHDYANRAYERSVHAGLTTCHDCHIVPIRHYPRNLVLALFDRPQSADDITQPDVASVICTRCHSGQSNDEPLTGPMSEDVRLRVVKIDQSPLHMAHMGAKERTPGKAQGGDIENKEKNARPEEHPIEGHAPVRPDWDEKQISCMDCHGAENNRAHRFEALKDNCVQCHEDIQLPGPRLSKLECRECHFEGFIGVAGVEGLAATAPPKVH